MRIGSLLRFVAMALLSLAFTACIPYSQFAYYQSEPSADAPALGSVTLTSREAGDATFAPGNCRAGDERQFLGGDFVDERAGMALRFVLDPLYGPAVRVYSMTEPHDRTVVFRRWECRTFEFDLVRTGLSVNDVDEYRISLDLDCANDDGTVVARLSSDSCL